MRVSSALRPSWTHRFSSAVTAGIAIIASLLVIGAPAARADTYTFDPFNVTALDFSSVGSTLLTGAPAGVTYYSYSVSFDWVAGPGDPWSEEAVFALVNGTPDTGTFFYANPGSAPNSASNDLPTTLNWSGFLDTPYVGGDPLHFWYAQAFDGSQANWSNITVTLETTAPTPPTATLISVPSVTNSTLATGAIDWYQIDYISGALTIDTLGSSLTPDNDTEIALYDAVGALIGTNDDIDFLGDNLLSSLSFVDGQLAAGTYYIAVGAWNSTFASGFVASSTSAFSGNYQLNVTLGAAADAPEPGAFALLATGAPLLIVAVRRRRSAA